MLRQYIEAKRQEKAILIMTHIVVGYPSLEESYRIIKNMVEAGVDLMELQIPFSEPIADGPVILHANQQALVNGVTVDQCFELARRVCRDFNIPFLFMSYLNIAYKYGIKNFVRKMRELGIKGSILPDLPHEVKEAAEYIKEMDKAGLSPIFLYSPTTSEERMKAIGKAGHGFIYAVARKGVTGVGTSFSAELNEYIKMCRRSTDLPLALGFGVQEKKDVDFLKGKVDIAVIGTQSLRVIEQQGIESVKPFLEGMR